MQLTIFNGSPRGKGSNTQLLLDAYCKGFQENASNSIQSYYLKSTSKDDLVKAFLDAGDILIAFPLYTDAMPGIVKEFLEFLNPKRELIADKNIAFLVQSGFPELNHILPVERYLQKLVARMKCNYMGTIMRGGIEGIKIQPNWYTRRIYEKLEEIGYFFGHAGFYQQQQLQAFASPVKLNIARIIFIRIMKFLGLFNFYWNRQLKKNNAFGKRNARPYEPSLDEAENYSLALH